MGSRLSKTYVGAGDVEEDKNYATLQMQRAIQRKIDIPLRVMVAHYMPSSFPLVPSIDSNTNKLCKESWKSIVSTEVPDPYGGPAMSGITAFYNEFYDRLVKSVH
jgi:hypothetical protein